MTGIIAAALLLSQPTDPPHPECPALASVLRADLTALALDAEALDVRELLPDLATLRGRLERLHGAPCAGEVERFPALPHVRDCLWLNRQFRAYLVRRLAIDLVHAEDLYAAIADTDRLHRAWDLLREAQEPSGLVCGRRQALAELRHAIGAGAFYASRMPPPVPVWAMRR